MQHMRWDIVVIVVSLASMVVVLVAPSIRRTTGRTVYHPVGSFSAERVPDGWKFTIATPDGCATATWMVDDELAAKLRDMLTAGLAERTRTGGQV